MAMVVMVASNSKAASLHLHIKKHASTSIDTYVAYI